MKASLSNIQKQEKMEASVKVKVFHWLPRSLCIIAIAFVSLFAFDSFGPGRNVWQQLSGFLMELIPSFILLALLLVAWKWEYVGGIAFAIIGMITSPLLYMWNYHINHSVGLSIGIVMGISFPFIVVGFLFLVSNYMKKKYPNYKDHSE